LVIGGGDGGAIEEIMKHRTVEHVRLVELDAEVIAAAREYLPSVCGDAFDDPRLSLTIGDGAAHLARSADRYDVIIVDSTDPIGPGVALFTPSFYQACKRCLAPGGILVTQSGVTFVQGPVLRDTLRGLGGHFAEATCYLATIPAYIGGPMAFGWASDDPALSRTPSAELARRLDQAAIETRYYTPEVHRAAFALPAYLASG
jgi:spermidine synthase